MLFTELRFLAFFVVVFAVYWGLPRNGPRKAWLLGCSYLFYAAWDWRFLSLIVASTLIDFIAGRRMAGLPGGTARRPWLWISLLGNLGILGFFKYYDFFVTSAAELSAFLGLPLPLDTLRLVLPVGISFYTFQSLSYTIDIYRGRLRPTRSLLDFALFVAFFPQLVAGPIVRAAGFLPQLRAARRLANVGFRSLLTLFLLGYVKKACIADPIARVIDPVFASPESWTASAKWLASVLYTLQIYCDFSGYSDMAIACAGMLGYRLTENFAFPYLATSIREFWRRWHISLSTWFRDYLYVPLGGGRRGRSRVAFNLFLVFLLCGLWHGAAWTFVVWGLVHGLFLALERVVPAIRVPRWLAHLYVLFVVDIAFVVFRSADLGTAATFLSGMFPPGSNPAGFTVDPRWWLLVAAFALTHAAFAWKPPTEGVSRLPGWVFALAYGAAVALVLPWAAGDYQPFIYFQF